MNSQRTLYPGYFFALVFTGIAILSIVILKPFFSAIAWAIVLSVGFLAPWKSLERRLAPRRGLAAGLAVTTISVLVLLPAVLLASVLAAQAGEAVSRAGDWLKNARIDSPEDLVTIPAVSQALAWVERQFGFTAVDVQKKGLEVGASASSLVARISGQLVVSALDTALTFAMTMFLLFFFLRDGASLAEAAAGLLPLDARERESVVARLRSMLQTIFRGSLLCALIQGLLGGIGWVLAGLPSGILAGAGMAILSLLPVGGTAIVWGPGAIWLWIGGHKGPAVFLVIWGVVVTSFLADNVLKPLLIRGKTELNTLVVFLGVFGGLSAFGLLGIFIGPMALATATTLLGTLREKAAASQESLIA